MKVPKEIAAKAAEAAKLQKAADEAKNVVLQWLFKNTPAIGCHIENIWISDMGHGYEQGDGEWCELVKGASEDDCHGNYYHPIEGEDKFLAYSYVC